MALSKAEIDRRYRLRHREALRELGRARYSSDPRYGPSKYRAWRSANAESVREATRSYKRRNPERNAIYCSARRARKHGSAGSYTPAEWRALKAQFEGRCAACGANEHDVEITADHVVPLARGGSNLISNVQPLCRPCNLRKHLEETDFRNRADLVLTTPSDRIR